MADFYRGAKPPRPGPRTAIVRVKGTELQTFTFLSASVFGCEIHWFGGRSHECMKLQRTCKGCASSWPVKWKGYVHALSWADRSSPVFLELTYNAVERIRMALPNGESLRGVSVQIAKSRGGAKGRYVIAVLERRMPESELQAEEEPLPMLQFLWNCKNPHSQNGSYPV